MALDFNIRSKGISARAVGVNKALRSMIAFNDETFKSAKKRFNKMLIILRKEIRKETPVDTGDLRRSVKILSSTKERGGEFEGEVGPDGTATNRSGVSYAPFVVFGTRFKGPNNFILRGSINAVPGIRKEVIRMRLDLKTVMRKVKSKG